jgi:hypothetical protein
LQLVPLRRSRNLFFGLHHTHMTLLSRLPLLFFGFGLLAACSDTTELGLSLVEQERSDIVFSDTFQLDMTTVATAPFKTSSASRWLCGAYNDPIFGETEAGFYCNFRIPTTNISFPNATFDSLVLTLAYDTLGHYGSVLGTPTIQSWQVLELNADITPNTTYKSDATFATKTTPLADFTFTPAYRDTVLIDTNRLTPHLRIRLDNAFGATLLNPPTADIYTTNNNFKSFFKGIFVRATGGSANNDCIVRFLPKSTQTKLTLYYTDNTSGSPVAKSFSYLTDEDAESVVATNHNYLPTSVLNNNPTDTLVYVQGANGVSAKVKFPFLPSLGKIVINKAELIFQSPFAAVVDFPTPLQLVAAEKVDTAYILIDDLLTSLQRTGTYSIFDGARQNVSTDLVSYRMNISQYLQRVADGEVTDSAMYIQAVTVLEPFRIALANQNSTAFKAKLSLTYTKID